MEIKEEQKKEKLSLPFIFKKKIYLYRVDIHVIYVKKLVFN